MQMVNAVADGGDDVATRTLALVNTIAGRLEHNNNPGSIRALINELRNNASFLANAVAYGGHVHIIEEGEVVLDGRGGTDG